MTPSILLAQNDYNNYQDFNQTTSFPDYSPSKMANYWGEYQWFLFDTLHHWSNPNIFDELYYKIEVVSFPFVVNFERTLQAGLDTFRIMTIPSIYNNEKDEWSAIPFVKRVDFNLVKDSIGNTVNNTLDINVKSNLCSSFFKTTDTTPYSSQRIYFPHSVLKHTLYAFCSDFGSSPIDSLSFVLDHTRGRMRHYPFNKHDYNNSSTEKHFDLTIQQRLIVTDSFTAKENTLQTIDYFPLDSSKFEDCPGVYLPDINDTSYIHPSYFIRPAPFSLTAYDQLNLDGTLPVGYQLDSTGTKLQYIGGIKHTYVIDHSIDLTVINPGNKVIYNPSEVIIEADSLVFPSGYTFKTIRAVYPTATEVANTSICPDAGLISPERVLVPTDLDTSLYFIESGAKLTIEPCVYIYDAKFIVRPGGTLVYDPVKTYGNFSVIDSGGTIDTISNVVPYCNNCLCVQESVFSDSIYSITQNTTWTGDKIVSGQVIIQPGATLIIQHGTIQFADSKRTGRPVGIWVKQGGRLVVDSARLTVLECDRMWDGIEVWGNRTKGQTATFQGRIEIKNNSVIEHARVGVLLGAREPCPEEGVGGGMILASNSAFKNNHKGIWFKPYNGRSAGFTSASKIQNNLFFSDANLRDKLAFGKKGSFAFIQMNNIAGVNLKGNRYEDANMNLEADTLRTIGILAYDAYFTLQKGIDSSRFINLYRGIDAYKTGSYFRRMIIHSAVFDSTIQGISIMGGAYDYIAGCRFSHIRAWAKQWGTPPSMQQTGVHGWGIFLMDAKYTMVADNSFDAIWTNNLGYFTYGTVLANPLSAHVIYNTYRNTDYATQHEYNNLFTKIGCNRFEQNYRADWSINPDLGFAGYYGIGTDTMGAQGIGCRTGETTAGNLFFDQCYNVSSVLLSNTQFAYYGHGFHGDSTVPDTSCSDVIIDIEACRNNGNENNWCPLVYDPLKDTILYPGYSAERLADTIRAQDSNIEQYGYLGKIMSYLIDKGDTGRGIALLENLQDDPGEIPVGQVRQLLLPAYISNGEYEKADTLGTSLLMADSTSYSGLVDHYGLISNYLQYQKPDCGYTQDELQAISLRAGSGKPYMVLAGNQRALYDNGLYNLAPRQWESGQGQRIEKIPSSASGALFEYYPNPAGDILYLTINTSGTLRIYSIAGIHRLSKTLTPGTNSLSIAGLVPGIYFIEAFSEKGEKFTGKLIIAR